MPLNVSPTDATIKLYMQNNSQFRKKRSDTKIGTIEKRYGKDLGVRSDQKLGTYLKEKGYRSLSELLKNE